jgi:hypothetical protein
MKTNALRTLDIVAVAALVAVVGCTQKPGTAGAGERTGAALDRATARTVVVATNVAEKVTDAAKATAAATKEAAGQVVEKTGEVLEKAGTAVENSGANMQK